MDCAKDSGAKEKVFEHVTYNKANKSLEAETIYNLNANSVLWILI